MQITTCHTRIAPCCHFFVSWLINWNISILPWVALCGSLLGEFSAERSCIHFGGISMDVPHISDEDDESEDGESESKLHLAIPEMSIIMRVLGTSGCLFLFWLSRQFLDKKSNHCPNQVRTHSLPRLAFVRLISEKLCLEKFWTETWQDDRIRAKAGFHDQWLSSQWLSTNRHLKCNAVKDGGWCFVLLPSLDRLVKLYFSLSGVFQRNDDCFAKSGIL